MRRPNSTLSSLQRPTSPLSKHLGPGPHPDGTPQKVHAGGAQPSLFDPAPAPAPASEPEQPELPLETTGSYDDLLMRLDAIVEETEHAKNEYGHPDHRKHRLALKYASALRKGAPSQYDYSVSVDLADMEEQLGVPAPFEVVPGNPEATAKNASEYLRQLPTYAETRDAHEQGINILPDGTITGNDIHVGHKRSIPSQTEYGDFDYAGSIMLHNHPRTNSLSPNDIRIGLLRRAKRMTAVTRDGDFTMEFDWSSVDDPRAWSRAVDGWAEAVAEDAKKKFSQKSTASKFLYDPAAIRYGSGHAMGIILRRVLPDLVTYTTEAEQTDLLPVEVIAEWEGMLRDLLERNVFIDFAKQAEPNLPPDTDCMGDRLVSGTPPSVFDRVQKHLGPGPHPDGTPQEVHGKKGAGDGAPPAPEAAPTPPHPTAPSGDLPDPPMEPGKTPIPDGHVRAFHWTTPENAQAIREEGFRFDRAQGATYDEPAGVWFDVNAGTWGSTGQGRALVEVALPPDTDPVNGGFSGTFVLAGDVPASAVVAVHEDWHDRYRSFVENGTVGDVVDGEYDDLLDMPDYAKAIQYIKSKVSKHLPGEHNQKDHGRPKNLRIVTVEDVRQSNRELAQRMIDRGMMTEEQASEMFGDPADVGVKDNIAPDEKTMEAVDSALTPSFIEAVEQHGEVEVRGFRERTGFVEGTNAGASYNPGPPPVMEVYLNTMGALGKKSTGITPGMYASPEGGGIGAAIRHEYAHHIEVSGMPEPFVGLLDAAWKMSNYATGDGGLLTSYAMSSRSEYFAEAFAIATDDATDFDQFGDRAKRLLEAIRSRYAPVSKHLEGQHDQKDHGRRDHEVGLFQYLDMMGGRGAPGFVKEHGTYYGASSPLPDDLKCGTAKECYRNAAIAAIQNPKYTYVEGYASPTEFPGLAIHHAWLVDDEGKVYDVTWDTGGGAYYGVPVTTEWLREQLVESGVYGFLSHRGNDHVLGGIAKHLQGEHDQRDHGRKQPRLFDPETFEPIVPEADGSAPVTPTDPRQLELFDPDWSPVMSEQEAIEFIRGSKFVYPVAHTTATARGELIRGEGFRWGPYLDPRFNVGHGQMWGQGIYFATDLTTAGFYGAASYPGEAKYGGVADPEGRGLLRSTVHDGRTLIAYVKTEGPLVLSFEEAEDLRDWGRWGNEELGIQPGRMEVTDGYLSGMARGYVYAAGGLEALEEFDAKVDQRVNAFMEDRWAEEREKFIRQAQQFDEPIADAIANYEDFRRRTTRNLDFVELNMATAKGLYVPMVMEETLEKYGVDSIFLHSGRRGEKPSHGPGGNQMIVWDPHKIAIVDSLTDHDESAVPRSDYFDPEWVRKHLGPGPHPDGSPQSVHAGGAQDRQPTLEEVVLEPESQADRTPKIAAAAMPSMERPRPARWNRWSPEQNEYATYEEALAAQREWDAEWTEMVTAYREEAFGGMRRNRAYAVVMRRVDDGAVVNQHSGYFTSRRSFDEAYGASLTFKDRTSLDLSWWEREANRVPNNYAIEVYDLGIEREHTGSIRRDETLALRTAINEWRTRRDPELFNEPTLFPQTPEGAQSEQLDVFGRIIATMGPPEQLQMDTDLLPDEVIWAEKLGWERAAKIASVKRTLDEKYGRFSVEKLRERDAVDREVLELRIREAMSGDLGNGYRTSITSVSPSGSQMTVSGKVLSPSGSTAGRFTRRFDFHSNGEITVYHAIWEMERSHQGKGAGTLALQKMVDAYVANDVSKVSVGAGLSVGGYAWASMGFDFITPPQWTKAESVEPVLLTWAERFRNHGARARIGNSGGGPEVDVAAMSEEDRILAANQLEEMAGAYKAKWDTGWRPTAVEFAALGRESGPTFPLRNGKRAHVGKLLMLGRSWSGVMELPTQKRSAA